MDRSFRFTFEVSNQFRQLSPVAEEYIEVSKRQIAELPSAIGPRGGLYRLVTPPDEWRESQDAWDAFLRNVTVFGTLRTGRYVRPDRITPELRLGPDIKLHTLTAPVSEGVAVLPDGSTVEVASPYIAFPVRPARI